MKIALLHNPRPAVIPAGLPDDCFEEFDGAETITAIAGALRGLGVAVEPVVADRGCARALEDGGFDFVFNIAEGSGRRNREAVPAAVCELLGLPYTGSDPFTLAVTLDKWAARRMVSPEVPVARAVLVRGDCDGLRELRYPVIVKPNDEGSSKGIRSDAVASSMDEARVRCVRFLFLLDLVGIRILAFGMCRRRARRQCQVDAQHHPYPLNARHARPSPKRNSERKLPAHPRNSPTSMSTRHMSNEKNVRSASTPRNRVAE